MCNIHHMTGAIMEREKEGTTDETVVDLVAFAREVYADPRTGPEVRLFTDEEEVVFARMQLPHTSARKSS